MLADPISLDWKTSNIPNKLINNFKEFYIAKSNLVLLNFPDGYLYK